MCTYVKYTYSSVWNMRKTQYMLAIAYSNYFSVENQLISCCQLVMLLSLRIRSFLFHLFCSKNHKSKGNLAHSCPSDGMFKDHNINLLIKCSFRELNVTWKPSNSKNKNAFHDEHVKK